MSFPDFKAVQEIEDRFQHALQTLVPGAHSIKWGRNFHHRAFISEWVSSEFADYYANRLCKLGIASAVHRDVSSYGNFNFNHYTNLPAPVGGVDPKRSYIILSQDVLPEFITKCDMTSRSSITSSLTSGDMNSRR